MIDNALPNRGRSSNFCGALSGRRPPAGQTGLNVLTPLAEYIKTKVNAGRWMFVTLDEVCTGDDMTYLHNLRAWLTSRGSDSLDS